MLWRDLDWEAGTIKVSQQVQAVQNKTTISLPKNDKIRTLPLPAYLVDRLREHWRVQLEERRLRGPDWKEHGLIFPSDTGTPMAPRNLGHHLEATRDRIGLPDIHLHALRHTCATILGELEVSDRVIGGILGHSPETVTARYAHPTIAAMREAIERLARVVRKHAA